MDTSLCHSIAFRDRVRGLHKEIPPQKDIPLPLRKSMKKAVDIIPKLSRHDIRLRTGGIGDTFLQFTKRKRDFTATAFSGVIPFELIKSEISRDFRQVHPKPLRTLRRDTIPNPEPRIVHTLLRVLWAFQNSICDRIAICTISVACRTDRVTVPPPVQRDDLLIRDGRHLPVFFRYKCVYTYRRQKSATLTSRFAYPPRQEIRSGCFMFLVTCAVLEQAEDEVVKAGESLGDGLLASVIGDDKRVGLRIATLRGDGSAAHYVKAQLVFITVPAQQSSGSRRLHFDRGILSARRLRKFCWC